MINLIRATLQKFVLEKSFEKKGTIPKRYFHSFLPTNPIIVDAGAAHGIDSVEMAKIWSLGTIYAFEPIPKVFSELINSTATWTNIHTFNLALSDTTGTFDMFVSGGDSDYSSSLLEPKEHLSEHPTVSFDEKISVKTITLDQWAADNQIINIDLLWLDLQGSEPAVLKASPKILQTVKVIYTEVSLKELYEGTSLYPEFRSWLESQGFRVEREELAWEDAGNVLFVREQ